MVANQKMNEQQNVTTREFCGRCHRVSPVGFHVQNDIWEAVAGRHHQHDILCILCFAQLGDEKHIVWEENIEFYPVSYATHHAGRVPEYERPEMLKIINEELSEQLSVALAAADPGIMDHLKKLEGLIARAENDLKELWRGEDDPTTFAYNALGRLTDWKYGPPSPPRPEKDSSWA